MSRIALLVVVAVWCFCSHVAYAEGMFWTDEELAERSVAVFVGKVKSVARFSAYSEYADLLRAVVTIESVGKGDAAFVRAGEPVAVYFELPRDGNTEKRCPTYASIKEGQRSRFFVRLRRVGEEWRAFIETGSDVREAPKDDGTKKS